VPETITIRLFDSEEVDKFKDKSTPVEITHIVKQARYFYEMAVVEKIKEDNSTLTPYIE